MAMAAARFGPRSFVPTRLSGCVLWLAADRITGLADGASVTSWPDRSGHGNNAAPGAAPVYKVGIVNGKPVVRFDGLTQTLLVTDPADHSLDLATGGTWVMVVNPTVAAKALISKRNVAGTWQIFTTSSDLAPALFYNSGASSFNRMSAVAVLSAWHVLTTVFSGPALTLDNYVDGTVSNGVLTGTVTSPIGTGTDPVTIASHAGGSFLAADYAEIVLYNRALSAAELTKLHRYLGRKYAVVVP